jgi:hypothetical protein
MSFQLKFEREFGSFEANISSYWPNNSYFIDGSMCDCQTNRDYINIEWMNLCDVMTSNFLNLDPVSLTLKVKENKIWNYVTLDVPKNLLWALESKKPRGTFEHQWDVNIKILNTEISSNISEWLLVVQFRDLRLVLVDTEMGLRVAQDVQHLTQYQLVWWNISSWSKMKCR